MGVYLRLRLALETVASTNINYSKLSNTLAEFRQNAYAALGPARDALFELADAVLLTRAANSFVELSTCPVFRRRWPSAYEALQDSCPDRYSIVDP